MDHSKRGGPKPPSSALTSRHDRHLVSEFNLDVRNSFITTAGDAAEGAFRTHVGTGDFSLGIQDIGHRHGGITLPRHPRRTLGDMNDVDAGHAMTRSARPLQFPRRAAVTLACLALMLPAISGAGSSRSAPPTGPGGGFVDVTEAVGLSYAVRPVEPDDEGDTAARLEDGGLALVDIDGDRRPELYVAHGGGEPGRLFSWDGRRFAARFHNGGIEPAAPDRAGYFIDLDDDGATDFLSIHRDGAQAFRNDGSGRFAEMPDPFPTGSAMSDLYSMAAGDFDRDGDLDLFFAQWGKLSDGLNAPFHYLWRNDGRGRFEDITDIVPIRTVRQPGLTTPLEVSFTPTFSDIDGDGYPDVLLAGDFGTGQVLRNEDGRRFVDIRDAVITDENGMGAAVGDYDRDGDMDWFVTSIHDPEGRSGEGPTGNRLYRNLGDGRFEDATDTAGVREGGWGWGACFADFDNDGHVDIFHTNGYGVREAGQYGLEEEYVRKYAGFLDDPSRLFMANGDGTFSERSSELGIRHTGQGRGAVCADYDGDGRVDILIANHNAAPTVYRNRLETDNRWLAIDLEGRHANPLAVGARVTVHTDSGRQVQEVRLGGAYLSQAPTTLHFGLGRDPAVRAIEVDWPGPGNRVTRIETAQVDRRLTVRQPEPGGQLLSVVGGAGTGLHPAGARVVIEAEAVRGTHSFHRWEGEGGISFHDINATRTTVTMPHGPARAFPHYLPGPPLADKSVSAARRWIEVLLEAIRDDTARPTVHARNLFHVAAAMYDAWAGWSDEARALACSAKADTPCAAARPAGGRRYPAGTRGGRSPTPRCEIDSPSLPQLARRGSHSLRNADTLMTALGYDPTSAFESRRRRSGAALPAFYITSGLEDGSNERNGYANLGSTETGQSGIAAVRSGAYPGLSGPRTAGNRWIVGRYIDQSGHVFSTSAAEFISPEWGRVAPFALSEEDLIVHRRDGAELPRLSRPRAPAIVSTARFPAHYKWGFALVARWSSHLSPDDGVLMDIAPSGIGNLGPLPRRFEDYPGFYDPVPWGPGYRVNPVTGKPYVPQPVPRGDYTRVLAEYWADGPDSETPPGHWFTILNAVGDHERLVRRLGGNGPMLDRLEWDVKAYFALGGAMHDVAVAAWGIKGWYDYIRPVSALRAMAGTGGPGEPAAPGQPSGDIPLAAGFVERIGSGDPLAGENGEHVGKIKLLAWRGPGHVDRQATGAAGVGWIRAEDWWPYQRPTFVTPPFAGYVSGHSTFSRAAAEVLTALTGDPFFPGGMSAFPIPADSFLVFERGPSVDMVLQWATYRDAADQCSLSRIWGGIHPPADDIPGRLIGERIGRDAFRLAISLFEGDDALVRRE